MSYFNTDNDLVINPFDLYSEAYTKVNPYRNRETITGLPPQQQQQVDTSVEFNRNMNNEPSAWVDAGVGVLNIVPRFADDIISTAEDLIGSSWLLDDADLNFIDIPRFDQKTWQGEIVNELGTLVAGFYSISKFLKLGKSGKALLESPKTLTRMTASGGVGILTDFIFSNPEDGNLANMVQRNKHLKNAITEYLAVDQDDSALEARLKHSAVGFIVGTASDSLFQISSKIIKHYKNTRLDPLDADDQINEILGLTGNDTAVIKEIASRQIKNTEMEETKVLSEMLGSKNKELIDKVKADSKAFGEHVRLVRDDESALEMVDKWSDTTKSIYDVGSKSFEDVKKLHEFNVSAIGKALHNKNEEYVKTLGWERAKKNSVEATDKLITKLGGSYSKKEILELANINEKAVKNLDVRVVQNLRFYEAFSNELFEVTKEYFKDRGNDLKKVKMLVALEEASRAGAYLKGIKSEAGRALNASKIQVGNTPLSIKDLSNEDVAKSLNIQEALAQFLKEADVKDLDDLMRKVLLTKGDLRKMDKLVDKRGDLHKIVDILIRKRYQNMLSTPAGRFIDLVSTGTNYTLMQAIVRPISRGLVARNHGYGNVKSIKLAVHQSVEAMTLLKNSIGEQLGVLRSLDIKTIRDRFDELDKLDTAEFGRSVDRLTEESNGLGQAMYSLDNVKLFRAFRNINGMTDGIGSIMSKVYNAEDVFASAITQGVMRRTDQTFRRASRNAEIRSNLELEGILRGDDVLKIEMDIKQKLARLNELDNAVANGDVIIPKEGDAKLVQLKQGGIDSALEVTFQQDLNPALQGLEKWLGTQHVLVKALKSWLLPFMKTPLNLIKQAVQFTPVLRKASSDTRKALSGELGEVKRIEANVKMAIGGTAYAGAYMLAMNGIIRGKHRDDEKAQLLAQGVQEYSLNVGGRSYKFNRLDPLATMLGMTADLVTASKYMEQQEVEKATSALFFGFAENIMQKSWLQGIGELYKVPQDYERYGERYIANQLRTFAPLSGLFGQANRMMDNETRAMADVFDRTILNVYWKQALPKRYNFFGEELDYKPDGIEGTMMEATGIYTSKIHGDPLMQELTRLRSVPNYRSPYRIQGVKLTDEEKYGYMKYLSDVGAKARYTQLISSPNYKAANDYKKAEMVEKLERKLRDEAKRLFIEATPELARDIELKRSYENAQRTTTNNNLEGLLNVQ